MTKVLMSDQEWTKIQARALALGVSVPRVLVESTIGTAQMTKTQRDAMVAELLGVKALLANIANNVNQIAKALNSGSDVPNRQITAVLERTAVAVKRVEELKIELPR
ncbi:plasmid mobilization relaxosome protein MobC [Streptomyces chryseus]|uniref:plasmid mobilization relaxosome protein MobC n=1 Tax=Streptomyces chryseus TaxID=68186 RepID=UPI00142EDFCD|nr:plasmid mobilization relaxosome protein MobC [Streptomyces chryseus]